MRYWLILLLVAGFASQSFAQDNTLLQLSMDETSLETGQRYEVRIEVQNIEALWAADIHIAYDPSQIYIIGTESGSPVRLGDFLQGGDIIFNRLDAESGDLQYAFSIFSPADPVNGSGVLGRFEIVPLLAGTAQLRFSTAQVSSVEFITDEAGQRLGGNAIDIAFLPVLLEVQTSGEPATPPSEATATPTATATLDPILLGEEVTEAAIEATLVNVTAAPRTASPDTAIVEAGESSQPIFFMAIGITILAAIGLLVLFVLWRRR